MSKAKRSKKRTANANRDARAIAPEMSHRLSEVSPEASGHRAKSYRTARDAALWSLCRSTGCRVNEACRARVEHLNATKWRLRIPVENSKNNLGRTVSLNGSSAAMQVYLEVRKEQKTDSPYLFPGYKGQPMTTTQARRIINPLLEEALGKRIKGQSTHSLRHLKCTILAKRVKDGLDVADAARVMGHTPRTFWETYVHASEEGACEAVEAHEAGKES